MSKTITYSSIRRRGTEEFNLGEMQLSKYAAVHDLLMNELSFNGMVTEITKTSVTIVTRVLNCVDTTVYSGEEDDMLPLLAVIHAWYSVDHDGAVNEAIDHLKETVGLRAFYVTHALPLMVGQNKLDRILNTLIPPHLPEDMRLAIFKLSPDDRIAVYELVDQGISYDQIRQLLFV